MKYFKEGVLKYLFQNLHEIFKYFKMKYFIVHP